MRKKTMFRLLTCTFVLSLMVVGFAPAQDKVKLGAIFDLTAALDDNPRIGDVGGGFQNLTSGFTTNYSPRGTLLADFIGQRNTGNFFYTFNMNRFPTDSDLNYESHVFGGAVDLRLSRRFELSLTDAFTRSPDFTTTQVLGGIRVTPEGLFFDFEDLLLRRNGYSNTGVATLRYELSPVSNLSFRASHQLRRFDENPEFTRIQEQDTILGSVTFERELQDRTSWDLRYSFRHNSFQSFNTSETHAVTIGLRHQLSPNLNLRVGAGPSLSTSTGVMRTNGLNADAVLSYSLNEDRISISFHRRGAVATGIGSVSDTMRGSLGFTKVLFAGTLLRTSFSVYDTKPVFDNPVNLRGYGADATISVPITRNSLSLVFGGSYRDQAGTSPFGVDRTRFFVSLSFNLPGFLSF